LIAGNPAALNSGQIDTLIAKEKYTENTTKMQVKLGKKSQ
jgi:hypothetical protein